MVGVRGDGDVQAAAKSPRRGITPYPTYKDSGVEWLGEIPAHWRVRKVKRLCVVKRGASPRPIDDPAYFDDEGEYAWVRIADVTASQRYLETTTQRLSALGKSKSVALEPGELFVSIAATVGKPIITKIRCCIHDGFVYFVGLHENREFLYYLFSCGEPYKGLGKLGTQLNLNTDTIGDIFLPLPESREQHQIVMFLDRETAMIDAVIARHERLIELLHEKRNSIIARAVTRGLDDDVPMDDSGVEWLGDIPAHWQLTKMWDITTAMSGGTPSKENPAFWDGGIPWVSPKDMKRRVIDSSEDTVSPVVVSGGMLKLAEPPVVLIVVRGMILAHSFPVALTRVPVTINQDMKALRLRPHVDPEFFAYWLEGVAHNLLALLVDEAAHGTKAIRMDLWRVTPVELPPFSEQRAIVAFLDAALVEIDGLSTEVTRMIRYLHELRTALISAAVTGKIDVREEVA